METLSFRDLDNDILFIGYNKPASYTCPYDNTIFFEIETRGQEPTMILTFNADQLLAIAKACVEAAALLNKHKEA